MTRHQQKTWRHLMYYSLHNQHFTHWKLQLLTRATQVGPHLSVIFCGQCASYSGGCCARVSGKRKRCVFAHSRGLNDECFDSCACKPGNILLLAAISIASGCVMSVLSRFAMFCSCEDKPSSESCWSVFNVDSLRMTPSNQDDHCQVLGLQKPI